jgi:hypothetical protein
VGVAAKVALALVVVGAVAAVATPEVLVRRARADAAACVATVRAPRGPAMPQCRSLLPEFDFPAQFSWTHHDATYRAEELLARDAMDRYVDAAVGDPDPAHLAARADDVKRAQEVVEKGSQRISLEELGPAVGSPHLGKLAASIGDRPTLLDRAETFGLWNLRVDTLDAAFLEADFDEVDHLAHRFADWDPRDADLRTNVGAALCFTDPRAGLGMLERVPTDRADHRYANIQRNFGEMLAVMRACAHKLGEAPPSPPIATGAGEADADETTTIAAIRFARTELERDEAVERAVGRLQTTPSEGALPGGRVALLAAVLVFRKELEPALARNLAMPRTDGGEAPLGPRGLVVGRILGEGPGLHPQAPAVWLEQGAARLEALAKRAESPEAKRDLEDAAGALWTDAAIERALAGQPDLAEHAARLAAERRGLEPRAAALSIASAVYVAGDVDRADKLLSDAPAKSESAAVELGSLSLATQLRASLGDREGAHALAAKLEAKLDPSDTSDLAVEARWVALAFGAAPPTDSAPAAVPWTGMADSSARYHEHGHAALAQSFDAFRRALGAPPEQRRAFRYAWMDARGDLPTQLAPALVVAGRMLDDGASGGATETWLDALGAIDLGRMRLRAYAFHRMAAARMRGDDAYAEIWSERLDVLRRLASDEDDAEIARFLRF